MPAASALRRLLSSNRTVTGAGVAAGANTKATLKTALGLTTDAQLNEFIVGLGQHPDGERRRGLELMGVGVGANDTTFLCKVWKIDRGRTSSGDTADWVLTLLATYTFTLSSTLVGNASGELVASTEYLADGVSVSVGTVAAAIASAYNAAQPAAASPADNTPGLALVVDTGNCDVLLEPYTGSSATSCNVLYRTVT